MRKNQSLPSLLTLITLLLAGCQATPRPTPVATTTPAISPSASPTAAPILEPPTITPIPTASASRPGGQAPAATQTMETMPTRAVTAAPTPNSGSSTAGAATPVPLASPGNVEQPPYQASACSDKYPCNDDIEGWEARIRVPAGFQATYFARVTGSPTSLAFGPDGLLYAAVQEGTIYTIDSQGQVAAYVGGFNTPTGIAFQPGTGQLFVSSRLRNENVNGEAQISVVQGGGASQLFGGLPCCYTYLHAANGIAFGPDGFGYVSVGARADHGEILDGSGLQDVLHPWEATILRFSPDGRLIEPYAYGLRNAYDIAWDANGQLYATDNAPDFGPPDELHRVVPGGQHGYPWYDCDSCFSPPPEVTIVPPIYQFIPHSAAAGLTVYLDDNFPGYYNSLFVALWSAFPGAQKIMRFGPGGVGASDFAMGFAAPIDTAVGPDGALYVADWATGIIFRIAYG